MISNIQKLKKAREMRLSGRSLSEISKEIHVSIGSLSQWLKDITLTKDQLLSLDIRVKPKVSRGRMNSSIILRSKRIFKEKSIYEQAEKEFINLSKDPFFISGLSLYLSGGAKKGSFQFTSSDKDIIKIMFFWIKKYLNVEDDIIKERKYNKYIRIDISRINVLRRVIAWQKLLIKYYGSVLEV